MLPYAIGLDIGISSVGWATVALDEEEKPYGIIGMGSRIFDAAENPKNGDSLAAPRRMARSMRRRLRRHRHRRERIRYLLTQAGVLSEKEWDELFVGQLSDIYALRVKALDESVSEQEFARILLHLSQRRGFRSNRKNADSQGEDGNLLSAVSENQKRMTDGAYRTVGEMFYKDAFYKDWKRNKGGNYFATVSRAMIEAEVHQIFSVQRSLGMPFATKAIEDAYTDILLSQRSFDEGPGGNSRYGGNQIERMIGICQFEKESQEPRAPKASYTFEYFTLLQNVNHLRLESNHETIALSPEQRNQLLQLAHKTADLNFAKIRKELAIPEEYRFNLVHDHKSEPTLAEKKTKFNYLKAYHQMRTTLHRLSDNRFEQLTIDQRNAIARVLSIYKTSEKIREGFQKIENLELSDAEMDALETLNFSKFGHLSVKACQKLIPHLEQGMTYNEACTAAGYDFRGHTPQRQKLLHFKEEDVESITSPVVRRAISQTVKVVNAIIRERGCSPTYINIELAREMAKDITERNQLKKAMDENHAKNQKALERIEREYGISNPSGLDLVKYKLWEEQGGKSLYSQQAISLQELFAVGYAEVDHIIPYSKSFDDSYHNKALVLTKENRDKGNRLPLQYLTGQARENFIVWVQTTVHNSKKRQRLLREEWTSEDEQRFKERNLQDTKTMSRFMLNYLNDHLEFAPSKRKKCVTAVNGIITSYMRKRWGITKIRENGDLHHAVDALVIACTTDGMIQEISRYSDLRECEYLQTENGSLAVSIHTGEVLKRFPYPWSEFRKELEARLSSNPQRTVLDQMFPVYIAGDFPVKPLFVSRMPRRKVTGAAHKETFRSPKDGLVISKCDLTQLKLKNGEIENYYEPQSDRILYEALKERLLQYGGDAKKAFAEPFHKPKSDGTPGPLVKKVKLYEKSTLNVEVLQKTAVAHHDSMVRIDVFHVEGDGYYFVPIYIADTLKPELPSKACVASKPYEEWKTMQEENFIFSLYPNDLICVSHKKGLKLSKAHKESTLPDSYATKQEFLYYTSANISSASISCENHTNSYSIGSLGIKTLASIEKYTVDVLGNYHKVTKEVRQRFHRK